MRSPTTEDPNPWDLLASSPNGGHCDTCHPSTEETEAEGQLGPCSNKQKTKMRESRAGRKEAQQCAVETWTLPNGTPASAP